jgi:formyl-CoA transferase
VFAFTAQDKRPFVVHLSSPEKFWQGLLASVERPDIGKDAKYSTRPARIKNYESLRLELQDIFSTQPREFWLQRLGDADVPSGPLNSIDEVFADPQVQALGMKIELPHAIREHVSLVANPVRLSETPAVMVHAAPLLGADNDDLHKWI